MMFFQGNLGLITVVHEWFSWIFLLGSTGHIAANIKPLLNHLKSYWGQISVVLFTTFLILSFFSWGMITGPQLKKPIEQTLINASLTALAGLTGTTLADLLGKFKKQGIDATADQSIREISQKNAVDEDRLLGIVFLSNAK